MALELLEARRILEPPITAMAAARITPGELEALDEDLARIAAAAEVGDVDALTDADGDFHATIANSVGNPFLSALQDALATNTQRTMIWRLGVESGPNTMRRLVQAHERIRNAIAARDPALAALASEAHMVSAEAWIHKRPEHAAGNGSEWSAWLEI